MSLYQRISPATITAGKVAAPLAVSCTGGRGRAATCSTKALTLLSIIRSNSKNSISNCDKAMESVSIHDGMERRFIPRLYA